MSLSLNRYVVHIALTPSIGSYNTWTHNIPELAEELRGNWATLNPSDADTLGIATGEHVRVTTAAGFLNIEARVSPDVRPGVVVIHQFWGHLYESGMQTSRKYAGVNVNHLHEDRDLDAFSGMPVYNGRPCRVEGLPTRAEAVRGRNGHAPRPV